MATYSLCSQSIANTGEQACDVSKGVLKKLFIFNGAIAQSDYADEETFFNKLVANSLLSKSDSNKIFAIKEAQDLADASQANKEASLNLGFTAVVQEGKPGYKMKVFAGSDLAKRLRALNNQTIRCIEYDSNGTFWGTKIGTDFVGYEAKLFFTGNKIATGQNVEEGVVEVSVSILSASQYFDNSFWMKIGSGNNVEDITSQLDVNLTYISNASNVFKIGIEIPGSNLAGAFNAYDSIGAALAGLTFTAGTGTNYGTALSITTMATDASLKALTVTFDSTAYTALTNGTKIKLSGPGVSVLAGGGVTNTEIMPVILTKS